MTQGDTSSPGLAPAADPRVAVKIRIRESTKVRCEYWREKEGYPSVNEFMAEAIEEKIARMNGDYDLPSLEIMRLNQLVDEMKSMATSNASLTKIVTAGFEALMGLTRGDSYLLDDDSGELEGA